MLLWESNEILHVKLRTSCLGNSECLINAVAALWARLPVSGPVSWSLSKPKSESYFSTLISFPIHSLLCPITAQILALHPLSYIYTLKASVTPTRMTKMEEMKNILKIDVWVDPMHPAFSYSAGWRINSFSHFWKLSGGKAEHTHLSFNPGIPLLGLNSTEMCMYVHPKSWRGNFTKAQY